MPLCCSPCSAGNESTGDKEKLQQDQIKYQVLNQEYKRFSKAAGLRLQHERMEMAGFGPKQETKVFEKYSYLRYNKDGTIVVTDDWKNKGIVSMQKGITEIVPGF